MPTKYTCCEEIKIRPRKCERQYPLQDDLYRWPGPYCPENPLPKERARNEFHRHPLYYATRNTSSISWRAAAAALSKMRGARLGPTPGDSRPARFAGTDK